MRGAPMLAPADLDVERNVELERRLGGVSMTRRTTAAASSSRPSGTSNTSSSCTWRSIRTPSRPASASASSMRAIARLMRSALVPWIGALIAARSAPPRICGLGERMFG